MQSMKTGQKWFMAASAVAGLTVGAAVQAAPILSLDFQAAGAPTQAGFVAFETTGANPSADYAVTGVASSEITISLVVPATAPKTRIKVGDESYVANLVDTETFTYGNLFIDLYSDFVSNSASPGDNKKAVMIISGLDPSTQYDLQIWSIDARWNDEVVFAWWDLTGDGENPVLMGEIVNKVTPQPTHLSSNDAFSITARLTANADGQILLAHTATNLANPDGTGKGGGGGALNGLTISLVPEPASLGLLGLSGLILCRRRRVRRGL